MTEIERSFQIMRKICQFKIEYQEQLADWYEMEALLIENLRNGYPDSELEKVNDILANDILEFLLERLDNEHINSTYGTNQFNREAPKR